MTAGESVPVLGDYVRFTFTQNFSGFSWWVPDLPAWTTLAFQLVLMLIVIFTIPVYAFYSTSRRRSVLAAVAAVAIAASCLGHLTDALFVPYATDFIQVFDSPRANLADVYAYVGLCALALELLRAWKAREPRMRGVRDYIVSSARTRREFFSFLATELRSLRPRRGGR
jgi:lipoprotein signal peptidase